MAIAPTASTSIIMGNISPSIEPFRANAYRQDTMSGSHLNKNHVLDEVIKKKVEENHKLNYDEIWMDIITNDGSIQLIDIFTEDEKLVFKTAMEIDQRWVVELAADRQEYIDQTQSVNLFFRPDVHIKYLHAIHFMAWKHKLPTLYYCRSDSLKKADKVSKQIERQIIEEISLSDLINGDDCIACHS
jgi:ribonucleoside-diphosphate reductase alpha chain